MTRNNASRNCKGHDIINHLFFGTWTCKIGKRKKHVYGACRSAALSAFLKVDNRRSFFIFMRDDIVQLCCCAFYKAFLTDQIGISQELTLRATIAILGSVSSKQLLFHVHFEFPWRQSWDVWFHMIPRAVNDLCACYAWSFGSIWDNFCKLSIFVARMFHIVPLDMYQVFFASYLTNMLQRIRNILRVPWRRCYNVSGTSWRVTWRRCYNVSETSCKLNDEDVTTYQERLTSYLTKMLRRIRNILKSYLTKMLQRIRNVFTGTWRRCCNVSGTSWKLLEEEVTT